MDVLVSPSRRRVTAGLVRAVCVAALLPGCGHPSARDTFVASVLPVLEARCASSHCHGVLPDAEARGETINWQFFNLRTLADGRIADVDQAYAAARRYINTVEHPELSTLLRKPLAVEHGGKPHLGGANFPTRDHPAYRTLRDWIAAEGGGGEGRRLAELTPEQQLFATTVLPRLATAQCLNANCHGPFAPFTGFEPPILLDGQVVFGSEAALKNYHTARMHLFLGGDPLLSRLIRKALPLTSGGISHRGGNDIFFNRGTPGHPEADPTVAAIVAWAEAERAQALGTAAIPTLEAIVFVRGPAGAQTAFEHDAFFPGRDLFVLEPPTPGGAVRNLTAAAHVTPADVRDPAVSHDGRRVAFAMRQSATDAFNIYVIGLDGSGLVALTEDLAELPGGGVAANVQPTWGPDGFIYFVSTRAGHTADNQGSLDTELWRVRPDGRGLERWTFDPAPEVMPSFIGVGKSYGTLAYTILRQLGDRYKATVFRMPVDHAGAHHADPSMHPHHGATIPEDILYGLRTLPDGRFLATAFDRTNVWRGGRLAVIERQFGPELVQGTEGTSALPGFRHAFRILDRTATATGPSPGGLYRDPAPLPDGRILLAYAPGPVDLADPTAAPQLGIYVATLAEDTGKAGPTLASLEPLLDEPGVQQWDPEPVVRRPLEDDPTHRLEWDSAATTGHAELRHLTTLETILSNLLPTGRKTLRADIAYARFLVPVLATPKALATAPLGLGKNLRSVIVGEAPPAGDSFNLSIPARTPFRMQFLDSEHMAIGNQFNLWAFLAPGERFGLSVAPDLYPIMCGNCHGSLSGDPGEVGGPVPDVITAASVTAATHENKNPRRPLAPVDVPVGGEVIAVDFRADVQPLLTRSCATTGCHAPPAPAGGLDLVPAPTASFDSAYEALLQPGAGSVGGRKYVDEGTNSAYNSHLAEIVFQRELGAPKALGSCPGGVPRLSAAERLTIVRWIEMGALYRGAP